MSRELAHQPHSRWPVVTLSVLGVTLLTTGCQLLSPEVLQSLCRDEARLRVGEWWRMVTPLLVHDEGWRQVALNLAAIAVLGIMVERIFGRRWWLAFYLAAGVSGEIAGYAWQPQGAGASVAGLLGAMLAWLVLSPRLPWTARLGGTVGLAAAVGLILFRDIHGPPILTGALLAAVCIALRRKRGAG